MGSGLQAGVVVPALVRGAEDLGNLQRCLAALGRCDPAPERVVVVDDGSPEPVRLPGGLAGRAGWEVLRQQNRGPAAARNAGARRLMEDGGIGVLIFVDADIEAGPDAIGRMLAGLGAGGAGTEGGTAGGAGTEGAPRPVAIWGTVTEAHPHAALSSRYKNLTHRHFTLLQAGPTRHLTSMLVAVRRAAFVAAGGFDERLQTVSVEDVEFGRTLTDRGGQVILDTDLEATHWHRFTVRRIVKNDFHKARHHARTTLLHRWRGDPSTALGGPGEQRQLHYLIGVPLGAGALLCALGGRWGAAAGLTGALLAWERDLFAYLWRSGGAAFAAGCVPLMVLERGVVLAAVAAGSAEAVRAAWAVRQAGHDA